MQPPSLVIAATFTADPLREPLSFWLKELGLPLSVEFAPYNQLFQQLLDPQSLLYRSQDGAGVLLIRLEDWQRESGGIAAWDAASEARIERNLGELTLAILSAAQRSPAPLFASILPASAEAMSDPGRAAFLRRLADRFTRELAGRSSVYVISAAEILDLYPVSVVGDPHGDTIGHIPYSPAFFAAAGTMIARKLHAQRSPPRKVIAVDCDETLWKGVVGEQGPSGIEIDPPRRAVQELLLAQKESGMILCVTSKNTEQDVLDVWKVRDDLPLKREDFVATRINWQRKSENLRSLAGELSLGLDSFIFLDDNPVECAEVGATCPEVLAVELPQPPEAIPAFLRHVWAFDHLRVTDEDRRRTALYAENAERAQLRKDSLTLADFLDGLRLEVTIDAPGEAHVARVAQLTQRTNQFNCTTRRRSEGEIAEVLAAPTRVCLKTEVKDRFGDYGLVGVLIAELNAEALVVDTFLLSCRVLGRGVENRMLKRLGEIALGRGLGRVDVPLSPTKKNQPAKDFLEGAAARHREADGSGFIYKIPADEAAALSLTPFVAEIAAEGERGGEGKAAKESAAASAKAPSALMLRIARELQDVDAILAAIAADRRGAQEPPPRVEEAPPADARTPVEAKIVEIWSEVLAIDGIGTDQDFVELGGDSLRAAQVVARLHDAFPVRLRLDILFEARTISALAAMMMEALAEQGDEMDDLLSEVEAS